MAPKRISYREGDVIAVPLRDGSWGLGVVARMDAKGGLIGYFFAPKYASVPSSTKHFSKRPAEAVLVVHCGDLGLLESKWKVIGQMEHWERGAWSIPVFVRTDMISGLSRKIIYSEESLTREVKTLPCPPQEVGVLPKDGVWGAGAVEKTLSRLLSELSLSG